MHMNHLLLILLVLLEMIRVFIIFLVVPVALFFLSHGILLLVLAPLVFVRAKQYTNVILFIHAVYKNVYWFGLAFQ